MSMKMNVLVTGGCGFIGSHLARRLIAIGNDVTLFDDMSVGNPDFLGDAKQNRHCRIVKGDVTDMEQVATAVKGHDIVYHLAANANIPLGVSNTRIDLDANVIGTYNVLEAMRRDKIKKIAFTSSSAVYGEPDRSHGPVPEDYGPLAPISLYGGSKLAGEAYVIAYHHMFQVDAWIFRFANVVGPHGTHGVIKDFIAKLRKDPRTLEILGNGKQEKSFIYVDDCVDGMLHAVKHASGSAEAFNLGSLDTIVVDRIAEIVAREMGLKSVKFTYTGGDRGWLGDVPYVFLDSAKMRELGFVPKRSSEEAVTRAVRDMLGREEDATD
jgi:UDP-glucose 4-epimerase